MSNRGRHRAAEPGYARIRMRDGRVWRMPIDDSGELLIYWAELIGHAGPARTKSKRDDGFEGVLSSLG